MTREVYSVYFSIPDMSFIKNSEIKLLTKKKAPK
jgi:hypothetical protein